MNPGSAVKRQLPAARLLPPLPAHSSRPASRTMTNLSGRAPAPRKEDTSNPTRSDGAKLADQLLSSRLRLSSRKLAWILARLPPSASRLNRTQLDGWAMHAEDTVMN